MYLLRYIERC